MIIPPYIETYRNMLLSHWKKCNETPESAAILADIKRLFLDLTDRDWHLILVSTPGSSVNDLIEMECILAPERVMAREEILKD